MVDFFQSQLMAFGSFTALFSVLSRLKGGAAPNHAETGQSSSTLTYRYLTVYALLMASDWLQGPFMYHLLASEHHFAPSQISMLFVIGFAMAGISSPWIGRLADVYGRRFMCLVFCGLYAVSCTLICLPSWTACVVARLAGGLATSILFSVPESWLVSASHQEEISSSTLSSIFGTASFLNGLIAVTSGIVAHFAVDKTGSSKTPFRMAIVVLLLAAVILSTTWTENFGQARTHTRSGGLKDAFRLIRADGNLITLISVQTMFETSMYLFVFLWVPVMEQKASVISFVYKANLPLGIIFASFMCSMMLGSLLYSHVMKHSTGGDPAASATPTHSRFISTDPPLLLHSKIIGLLLLVASVALGIANFSDRINVVFWGFCLFEATVGVYFPAMGWLRSELIADEVRATYASLFRLPLNTLVTVSLLVGVEDKRVLVFWGMSAALVFVSLLVNLYLVRKQAKEVALPLDGPQYAKL